MSQKAVLVRVNGNLVQEVFNYVPDYEEAVQICKDEGYEVDNNYFSNYYSVEYEWIDIGKVNPGKMNLLTMKRCFIYMILMNLKKGFMNSLV